jgi:AcrR family transcriptional regulator
MTSETPRRQSREPGSIDSIARVAADLFYRNGYDATSMQDIADAAGLHKSSLYHHLRHKEELLEHVCRRTLDALDKSLEAGAGGETDRVIRAFDGALEVALAQPRETHIIVHTKPTTEVGRRILQRRRAYEHRFAELIEESQEIGAVRTKFDPLLMARLALGMINWLVEWYTPEKGLYTPAEVRAAATAFIAAGVGQADR